MKSDTYSILRFQMEGGFYFKLKPATKLISLHDQLNISIPTKCKHNGKLCDINFNRFLNTLIHKKLTEKFYY